MAEQVAGDTSASTSVKEEPAKAARNERTTREEPAKAVRAEKKEPVKQSARQKSTGSSLQQRLRNSTFGRFLYESYYELRHKVTWPTFEEARNMAVMVILLSAVVAAILFVVDFGLYHLFLLISGGK